MSDPIYELKCLRQSIDNRRARGEDVTFWEELYFSWIKDPEFLAADQKNIADGFYKALPGAPDNNDVFLRHPIHKRPPVRRQDAPDIDCSVKQLGVMKHHGGAPRKNGENLSRTTLWRRKKEKQLAMGI